MNKCNIFDGDSVTNAPYDSLGGHDDAPLGLYKGQPAVVGTRIRSTWGSHVYDFEETMIPNGAEMYTEFGWIGLPAHPE